MFFGKFSNWKELAVQSKSINTQPLVIDDALHFNQQSGVTPSLSLVSSTFRWFVLPASLSIAWLSYFTRCLQILIVSRLRSYICPLQNPSNLFLAFSFGIYSQKHPHSSLCFISAVMFHYHRSRGWHIQNYKTWYCFYGEIFLFTDSILSLS